MLISQTMCCRKFRLRLQYTSLMLVAPTEADVTQSEQTRERIHPQAAETWNGSRGTPFATYILSSSSGRKRFSRAAHRYSVVPLSPVPRLGACIIYGHCRYGPRELYIRNFHHIGLQPARQTGFLAYRISMVFLIFSEVQHTPLLHHWRWLVKRYLWISSQELSMVVRLYACAQRGAGQN